MASRLILSGIRSIEECIRTNPDRVAKILVAPGRLSTRLAQLCDLAKKQGIKIENNAKKQDFPHGEDDELVMALLHD